MRRRYGLPFLGDNNFLLSDLYEEKEPSEARWYVKAREDEPLPPSPARLTLWIDRKVMSKTISPMYGLQESPSREIPVDAWSWLPPTGQGE